jgi:CubicO group peptidase (beta-lactamase class C family)
LVCVALETTRRPQTLALAAMLALSACGHDRIRPPSQVRADTLATVGEQRGESPGIAVATVHDVGSGEPEIAVEVGGVAALADGRLVAPDTAFVWFSITKLFTATAIMQLHERGKLDIDAPVRDLLGDEWTIDEPRERPVTGRDLLRHSSGLGNPSVWAAAAPEGRPRPSVEAQLAGLLDRHGRRLHYHPGRDEGYSNLGYLALGRMIELADGRDYETYVREEILEVLGMDRTGFRWEPLLDRAVGHGRKGQFWTTVALQVANPEVFGPPLPRWITTTYFEIEGAPYGGLIGTVGDLGKFLAAHLQHGQWQGRRILSPTSVQAMQTVQRDHRGRPFDYALGWHTQLIDGERYFNHMGKGGGYRPAVYIWPSRRYGVAILTNQTRYDPRSLAECVPPLSENGRSTSMVEHARQAPKSPI